jgi:uncharacterized phiE125 gp8 family phage protein
MTTASQPPPTKLLRTVAPTAEPVSAADAKKQLEIASSDTSHDDHITDAIIAAREQFEHDTPYVSVRQTFELILDQFPQGGDSIYFPVQPVAALSSVTYMDGSTQQTLATTVADLDRKKRSLALKYDQEWPSIEEQTDAIVITFTAGYASASGVPRLIRQAILLQVAKWFEDRDMMYSQSPEQFDLAYERIIRRLMRSSYP